MRLELVVLVTFVTAAIPILTWTLAVGSLSKPYTSSVGILVVLGWVGATVVGFWVVDKGSEWAVEVDEAET